MRVFDRAVRIRTSQIESLGNVLTRAFDNNPVVEYILPDARTRPSVLSWFFNSIAIPTSRLCGEIYTTMNVDGGALWIRPGVDLTIKDAVKAQLPWLPLGLDRSTITRWINVERHLESVRRRLADKLLWYLLALGTERSKTEKIILGELMAPVLATADWDLRSCYVETFNEKELPSYEQCGFQIAGAGQIPNGGPSFWTLIRRPRRVAKPRTTELNEGAPVIIPNGSR